MADWLMIEGGVNHWIKLLNLVQDALRAGTTPMLRRLAKNDAVAVGRPTVSLPVCIRIEPGPLRNAPSAPLAEVEVIVETRGDGDDEQLEDLMQAIGEVETCLLTTANRELEEDTTRWVQLGDIDIEPEDFASEEELFKTAAVILRYRWGFST